MKAKKREAMASQEESEEKIVQYKSEAKKLDTKDDSKYPATFLTIRVNFLINAHYLSLYSCRPTKGYK